MDAIEDRFNNRDRTISKRMEKAGIPIVMQDSDVIFYSLDSERRVSL